MRRDTERAMEDTNTMLSLLGVAMEVNFAGYFASHFGYWTSADTDEEQETRHEHTMFPISIGCIEDLQEDELHVNQNEEPLETCTNDPSAAPTIMTVSRTYSAAGVPESASSNGGFGIENHMECLNDTVKLLREKTRLLEMKTIECHGLLKLDEATIRDLGSRLTLNVLENEYLNMEIDCLLNQKEKAHAPENLAIMQDLESAMMKIRYLKRKVMSTQLQARKKIAMLEKRITTMHEKESQHGVEIQSKLYRMKELENETVELRRKNGILADKNTELTHRLESAQKSISTFLENQKETMEETNQLREANGELLKKIEQLQEDRFADFEELVKLRRLNACLRDELRTNTRVQEETTAKDPREVLKKNLDQENRHFMFDYADNGIHPKNTSFQEKGAEYNYSSQGFNIRYLDTPSSRKTNSLLKTKFFDNLKKLVARRGNQNNNINKDSASTDKTPSSFVTSETRSSVSTFSSDELGRRSSSGSTSSCFTEENSTRKTDFDANEKWKKNSAWIQTSFRPRHIATRPRQRAILEEDRKVKRCKSDLETVTKIRRMPSGNHSMINLMQYLD